MGYFKKRDLNSDIHFYTQGVGESPSLVQIKYGTKAKLSKMTTTKQDKKIKCIINCSYFNGVDVLGRQQGELYNGTLDQKPNKPRYDYVILKDGSHLIDKFNSWDYQENVLVGFSCSLVLIKNAVDVSLVSLELTTPDKMKTKAPQTLFGQLSNGTSFMIVVEGRNTNDSGLNGDQCRTIAKKYLGNIKHLVVADSGGSSEMIVDGKIMNYLSDGAERSMLNGLAFLANKTKSIHLVTRGEYVTKAEAQKELERLKRISIPSVIIPL